MPTLTTSDLLTMRNIQAMVFAPPGRSKTFSSLTMSAKCPADFSHIVAKAPIKRSPPVKLDDLLWLGFDKGATDGFSQQGIIVPQINLADVEASKFPGELRDALSIVEAEVKAGRTTTVVVDTVSALDEVLEQYNRSIRGLEKFDLYGAMRLDHMNFARKLKGLSCSVLYLCHAKAVVELEGNSAAIQNMNKTREAAGLTGIIPAITGSSLNHYRRDASFIFPVVRKKLPGETHGFFFQTNSYDFESKSRIQLSNASLPADWRVIKAELAASKEVT